MNSFHSLSLPIQSDWKDQPKQRPMLTPKKCWKKARMPFWSVRILKRRELKALGLKRLLGAPPFH